MDGTVQKNEFADKLNAALPHTAKCITDVVGLATTGALATALRTAVDLIFSLEWITEKRLRLWHALKYDVYDTIDGEHTSATPAVPVTPTPTPDSMPPPGQMVWPTELTVGERGHRTEPASATYTVMLATEPNGPVHITIGVQSGEMSTERSISVSAESLTFSTAGWSEKQTVTVVQPTSLDHLLASKTFTILHEASGGGFDSVDVPSVTVDVLNAEPRVMIAVENPWFTNLPAFDQDVTVEESAGSVDIRIVALTEVDQSPIATARYSFTVDTGILRGSLGATPGDDFTEISYVERSFLGSDFNAYTTSDGARVSRAVMTQSVAIADDTVEEGDESFSVGIYGDHFLYRRTCGQSHKPEYSGYACLVDHVRNETLVTILGNDDTP